VAMCGQTDDLAPADSRLYALRDATSTVTSIPLICASILCKKFAENTDALVFDVKVGKGAFMQDLKQAEALAVELTAISREAGIRAEALVTSMDHPLGMKTGNSLEVQESIDVLKGAGPDDVRDLSLRLTASMLCQAVPARYSNTEAALDYCTELLENGSAFSKFVTMIEAQGGDLEAFRSLPAAPVIADIEALRSGVFSGMNAYIVGEAIREIGGGRYRLDQRISPDVGWEQLVPGGTEVMEGDILGRVHAASDTDAEKASAILLNAGEWDQPAQSIVRKVI